MANFLEQLVAEWYEFRHYFVRRNVKVGKRPNGGYNSELDIVAFNPETKHLVHLEPSMDAHTWEKREQRFQAKFAAGKEHIPSLFRGFGTELPGIEHIAVLVFAGKERQTVGGGKVLLIHDLMAEIRTGLQHRAVSNNAVPEQYVILRSLQFASNYWK